MKKRFWVQRIKSYEVMNPLTASTKEKLLHMKKPGTSSTKDQERNCCNVGRDKSVQKWHLPQEEQKVRIKKAADSGTTLYYHDDLLGSEDFPH